MKITYTLSFCLAASLAVSCQQPTNKLTKLTPGSDAYKQELARQINSKSGDLTYTLNKYYTENGKEYLLVNINGNNLSTQSEILVTQWTKLEGIKRTKGVSYSGAELKGLTVDIKGSEMVYKSLDRVID